MRTCFVSIPFGRKVLRDGTQRDFDVLYTKVIRPTVEGLDMEYHRAADTLASGSFGNLQKTFLSLLISSDLVIADISSDDPDVLYELGIRHAFKRDRTILISSGEHIPFNLIPLPVLRYKPYEYGHIDEEEAWTLRELLQASIEQSKRSSIIDSPIYQLFPELEVILPAELEASPRRRRRPRPVKSLGGFVNGVVASPAQVKGALEEREAEIRGTPEADPSDYLILLRRYRDLSDWDRVVAVAEDAPPAVADSPETRQMLALALNRRGASGDQDRAISLMQQLINETGGDSESFGILGRIYKDRYDQAKQNNEPAEAAKNLEGALHYYRQGFEKNPQDYYPGINVVNLLLQRGDAEAQAELSEIVPRVRAAVQEKLVTDRPDFWDLATDLQLAVVARDWQRAAETAARAAALSPSSWMLDTTFRDLNALGKTFTDAADQSRLAGVLAVLGPREERAQGVADD